jgi:hypothetical protein
MSDSLVTVATFATSAEAELARNLLAREGLQVYLTGAETVGILGTVASPWDGGVKLQVPAADEKHASSVLARQRRRSEESERDDYGLEAEPARRRMRAFAASAEDDDNDDYVRESQADALARRAWWSAVIGLLLLPPLLHFYSLALLLQLFGARDGLTAKGKRAVVFAIFFDAVGFVFGALLWRAWWFFVAF